MGAARPRAVASLHPVHRWCVMSCLVLACTAGRTVAAQPAADVYAPALRSTTVPPESRMELVRAPDWLGIALRVDKYQGRVWVLRRGTDGSLRMYPIRPAEVGGIYPDRPNYQLHIGSDDAVFLLSLYTGSVWHLTEEGPMNELLWRQLLESSDRARALGR